MTVDEYLCQLRTSRHKAQRLGDMVMGVETRAQDVRSPSNLGDGIPSKYSGENRHEEKLLKYADVMAEYRAAWKMYEERRDSLEKAIENIPYWAGCLIHHIYLYNVVFEVDDALQGADDILNTSDRRKVLSKVAEAKILLSDALRAQGVPIE